MDKLLSPGQDLGSNLVLPDSSLWSPDRWKHRYSPLIKHGGFNPNPISGRIPAFADSTRNKDIIGTPLYDEFWQEQVDRCINGYITGKMYIPGRYYYFLNFQPLAGVTGGMYPYYCDFHLELSYSVEWVKFYKNFGIVILKARRKGLSEYMKGAIINYGLTFVDSYRAGVFAGIDNYVQGLKKKIINGLTNTVDDMRMSVLKNNEKQIKVGYEERPNGGSFIDSGCLSEVQFETMFNSDSKMEGEYFNDVCSEESGENPKLKGAVESIKPSLMFGANMEGTFYIYGCVCAGTKVWINNGDLINIESLNPENGILGFDGEKISQEKITYWQPPKEKECYRITTFSGRVLECSYDHPILYSNKGFSRGKKEKRHKATKFVIAKDLKINDQVAVIEEVPIFGNKKMWNPRMVGWLVGDGTYGFDGTPLLASCDNEIIDYVFSKFNYSIARQRLTKENKFYYEIRIKDITKELRNLGIFGQTKLKKRLPLNIHSYSKEDICEFLGGFFDTDGHVNKYGKNLETITLTSSVKEMIFEVKLLLQKLGIHCNISEIKPSIFSLKKGNGYYYRINISSKKDIIKFKENIHFKIKYKQDNLDQIAVSVLNRTKRIKKGVKGLRFERIISVENIGIKPIYNLTAGTTNTYIANGIITHNTSGNILSGSKDFINIYREHEKFDMMKIFVPGTRLYFPFYVTPKDELFYNKELKQKVDPVENLRSLIDAYGIDCMMGCEDIDAAESNIRALYQMYEGMDDKKNILELKKNFPLNEEDAIISGGSNNFNNELLFLRLDEVEKNPRKPGLYCLDFETNDNGSLKIPLKVKHRIPTKDDPEWSQIYISQFPLEGMKNVDAGGVDSYNQDKTNTSLSLGGMVVIRDGRNLPADINGAKIKKGLYPVCWYQDRPPKKELFYDIALKISVFYDLVRDTMISAEHDFLIDYYKKNFGRRYLSYRPRSFDSPSTEAVYEYGSKIQGFNVSRVIGIIQSYVEEHIHLCDSAILIRELIAFDEINIGSDWDIVDALGYALMRILDRKTKPKSSNDSLEEDDNITWSLDKDGDPIMKKIGNHDEDNDVIFFGEKKVHI